MTLTISSAQTLTSRSQLQRFALPPVERIAPEPRVRPENLAPVLKWAGGKTRLMPELQRRLPSPQAWTGRYFEPFIGGAAVFINLFERLPGGAVLADLNPELINLYRVIRDNPKALIAALSHHFYDKDHFYEVRAQDPTTLSPEARAARMVFLNRTCFNGLWRVNRKGQFNVPFGRYTNPNICPTDRIMALSEAFQGVDLRHTDFETALEGVEAGDFVYFDPPYVPLTPTSSFTSYAADDFGLKDQERLAAVFDSLAQRGVHCMLSNSDTPIVRELYAKYHIDQVQAPRAISRNANGRKSVSEVIVTTYGAQTPKLRRVIG